MAPCEYLDRSLHSMLRQCTISVSHLILQKRNGKQILRPESCIEIPGLETDLSFNIPFLPPALSTRRPNSTWLFSNEKNDFQILFKFATWPSPSVFPHHHRH